MQWVPPPHNGSTHAWQNGPAWAQIPALDAAAKAQPSAGVDLRALALQARAAWLEQCRAAVTSADDATAALLIAVSGATRLARPGDPGEGPRFSTDWDALCRLIPALGSAAGAAPGGSMAAHAPWDHDEIAAWFTARQPGAPGEFRAMRRSAFVNRTRRFSGWWFEDGATLPAGTDAYRRPFSVGLTTDGRRITSYTGRDAGFRDRVSGFNARALTEMAQLAGLRIVQRPAGTIAGER